jgi:hypothetical protein
VSEAPEWSPTLPVLYLSTVLTEARGVRDAGRYCSGRVILWFYSFYARKLKWPHEHAIPSGNLEQIMDAGQGSDDPEKGHRDRDQELPDDIHTPEPLPDAVSLYQPSNFTLLKSRRLLTALWGIIIQGSQTKAFDSVRPLFTQQTLHWNTRGAGLIFPTLMVPSFAAPLVGWASGKYKPRWRAVIGEFFDIIRTEF